MVDSNYDHLHVVFLPYPAPGHTIPMLDTVRLFVSRRVRTTIITTPLNAPNIAKHLNININNNHNNTSDEFVPNIHVIPFPSSEVTGLPEGIENQGPITSHNVVQKFILAMELFKEPVEQFLLKTKANCIVSDLFFTFSTNLAKNIGIPRLAFQVTGFFPMCLMMELHQESADKLDLADDEPFVVPKLPHEITFTKSQVQKGESSKEWEEFMGRAIMGYITSFGDVFNTYYELEPDYADHYKNFLKGRRAWPIGPVSLCNRDVKEQFQRGQSASICENDCLKWLDSKPPNSVIYLSFGTLTHFKTSQLKEITIALEKVEYNFIFVVRARNNTGDETSDDDLFSNEGFGKRVQDRGLIITGWAPQVLILEHEAIGAFVTHCGWNSVLEGFSAGIPMVTWPLHAEHFHIEKLVTQVLKIGIEVGSKEWSFTGDGTFINHEKIEATLKQIMVGEEALEMRIKAKKLKELAYNAVKKDGSSYCALTNLLQEVACYSNS